MTDVTAHSLDPVKLMCVRPNRCNCGTVVSLCHFWHSSGPVVLLIWPTGLDLSAAAVPDNRLVTYIALEFLEFLSLLLLWGVAVCNNVLTSVYSTCRPYITMLLCVSMEPVIIT